MKLKDSKEFSKSPGYSELNPFILLKLEIFFLKNGIELTSQVKAKIF